MEAAARGLKKVDVRGLVAFEVPAAKVTAPGTQGQGWGCECTGGGLGLISHSCCNTLAHTCMVCYSTLRCLTVLEAGSPQWVLRGYVQDVPDFHGGSEVKASACNVGDLGSILGLGRSPGEGNGYPLQYSGPENSMDRGAWWATVHRDTTERLHSRCTTSVCAESCLTLRPHGLYPARLLQPWDSQARIL